MSCLVPNGPHQFPQQRLQSARFEEDSSVPRCGCPRSPLHHNSTQPQRMQPHLTMAPPPPYLSVPPVVVAGTGGCPQCVARPLCMRDSTNRLVGRPALTSLCLIGQWHCCAWRLWGAAAAATSDQGVGESGAQGSSACYGQAAAGKQWGGVHHAALRSRLRSPLRCPPPPTSGTDLPSLDGWRQSARCYFLLSPRSSGSTALQPPDHP